MIVESRDVLEGVLRAFKQGWGKVFNLGFKPLSGHYNIVEGGVTDWTGFPQSGKTELLMECIVNCAKWYGHRYLLYMPDSGSIIELIAKLAHKLSGKSFEEFYYNKEGDKIKIDNRLTELEVANLVPQILEMFALYDPRDKEGKRITPTPLEFWNYAADNKQELGLFGAVIDSWNYLKHDTEGFSREDKWLEYTLSQRNIIAEENKLHFHTIIHPSKATKDKNGQVIMPDMHSLKGGSEWAANAKSIIVAHRDFGSPITDVKIAKAKPKIVGTQGIISLQFDIRSSSYYYMGQDMHKIYAENPLRPEEFKPITLDDDDQVF